MTKNNKGSIMMFAPFLQTKVDKKTFSNFENDI